MDWYALFVETGYEEIVQQYLDYHYSKTDLRSLVPKRKILEKKSRISHYVIRKLLPGYVLIQTEMDTVKYKEIKKIPHIIRILSYGSNYSRINENEMFVILKLTHNSEIIESSKIYTEGASVMVKDGPLKGMEGFIKKINKHKSRATVIISFMGEQRIIDLAIEVLHETV